MLDMEKINRRVEKIQRRVNIIDEKFRSGNWDRYDIKHFIKLHKAISRIRTLQSQLIIGKGVNWIDKL